MRRNRKSWHDKLDRIALAALDAHKQTRGVLNIPGGDLKDVIRWFQEHQSDIAAAHAKFPRRENNAPPKTVKLNKDFLKFAKSMKLFEEYLLESGEKETDLFLPKYWKTRRSFFSSLKRNGQTGL